MPYRDVAGATPRCEVDQAGLGASKIPPFDLTPSSLSYRCTRATTRPTIRSEPRAGAALGVGLGALVFVALISLIGGQASPPPPPPAPVDDEPWERAEKRLRDLPFGGWSVTRDTENDRVEAKTTLRGRVVHYEAGRRRARCWSSPSISPSTPPA